ncbi:MAG: response regulator [Synechococcales cyanobacterium RU_4_20]|nr:response regulator [Synechococcales cyanobacterium RU_4_20]
MSGAKAEILLVDDQPDALRLLSIMLNSQGYRVHRVASGSAAIKAVQQQIPDLILLDIRMAGMDGYEVCQRLKAHEATQDIPIIFLSALNDTLDKVKAFNVGGVDYVTKPFEFAEVLARVENQIQICLLRKQLQGKNGELHQEIQRRKQSEHSLMNQAQKEQALNRVIQEIHKSMDLGTVFFTAISEIGKLLRLDFATIMNYSPQQQIWLPVAEYRQSSETESHLYASLPDEGNPITAKLKGGEIIASTMLGCSRTISTAPWPSALRDLG